MSIYYAQNRHLSVLSITIMPLTFEFQCTLASERLQETPKTSLHSLIRNTYGP